MPAEEPDNHAGIDGLALDKPRTDLGLALVVVPHELQGHVAPAPQIQREDDLTRGTAMYRRARVHLIAAEVCSQALE